MAIEAEMSHYRPSKHTPGLLAELRKAERRGEYPSVRELQAKVGASSTSAVLYNLKKLEREGMVTIGARQTSRHIRLTDAGRGYPDDTALLRMCLAALEDTTSPLVAALEARLR